jgi:hypothetical protein
MGHLAVDVWFRLPVPKTTYSQYIHVGKPLPSARYVVSRPRTESTSSFLLERTGTTLVRPMVIIVTIIVPQ